MKSIYHKFHIYNKKKEIQPSLQHLNILFSRHKNDMLRKPLSPFDQNSLQTCPEFGNSFHRIIYNIYDKSLRKFGAKIKKTLQNNFYFTPIIRTSRSTKYINEINCSSESVNNNTPFRTALQIKTIIFQKQVFQPATRIIFPYRVEPRTTPHRHQPQSCKPTICRAPDSAIEQGEPDYKSNG